MEYEIHRAANITPKMAVDVFNEHVESIRTKGQIISIKLWNGKIVDGRHRYHACKRLGIDPIVEEVEGKERFIDAFDYVMQVHNHRDLTKSQRASMAARVVEERKALAEEDASEQSSQICELPPEDRERVSQEEAAKMMDVSPRSVWTASDIQKNAAPEVSEAVADGTITLNAASSLMKNVPDHEEQKKIVAGGKDAVKEANKTKPKKDSKVLARKAKAALESALREADDYNALVNPKDFNDFKKAWQAAWEICNAWS